MKKILILTIVFLLSLSLGNTVFAADNVYEAAYDLLSQLNIDSEIGKPYDEAITREEFVAMAVRAMSVPLSSADDVQFTDCQDSLFLNEIATAKKYGLTNGTSATTFSPKENVSTEVAARIIVGMLGYTELAEAKGGYPYGYLNQANTLDIFDGVEITGEYISAGQSYQLMYNALLADVNIIYGVEGGQIVAGNEKGRNLLTENFGFEYVTGIVSTVGGYSVIESYDYDGSIVIGGKRLESGDLYTDYFAMNVDAWYNPDNMEVCAVIPCESNNSIVLNPDGTSYSSYRLSAYDENDRQRSYSLETDFTFILNGRPEIHTQTSFTFPHGSMQLVDNDGNGKYDFVIAKKAEYFVVRNINVVDSIAYDRYSVLGSVSLVSDDGNFVYLEKNGKELEDAQSIKTDNVLEIYRSANSKVCYVYVSSSSISGKLAETGDGVIVVNGKTYNLNSYFNNKNTNLTLGAAYTFFLASDGTITDISTPVDSVMQYGYLLDFGNDASAFPKPLIKLLGADGNIYVYEFTDKVKLNGVPVPNFDSGLASSLAGYQLIRYRLTSGKVSAVDTSVPATDWEVEIRKDDMNSLTKYMEKQTVYYRSNVNFGIPGVAFDKAIVFTVPYDLKDAPNAKYDDELFYINPQATLINDTDRIVDVYDYDENFYPGAVVVYFSTKGTLAVPSDEIASGIVREITDSVDDEGNNAKLLKIYTDGLYKQYYIDESVYTILKNNNKVPSTGDIVRATVDIKNRVTGLALDVKYNSATGKLTVNYVDNVGSYPYSYNTYYSGNVISKSGNLMTIKADSVPTGSVSALTGDIVNLCLASPRYVIYSKKTGEAKACDESYIMSGGLSSPQSGTYVLCKTRYYGVNTIYIYTE